MKKVQKTFAERAKAIQKKYTRAEWDAIERKDMLKELRALKDEQEQVRGLMEVADNADQMDQQGAPMPMSQAPQPEMQMPQDMPMQSYGGMMYGGGYPDIPEFLKPKTSGKQYYESLDQAQRPWIAGESNFKLDLTRPTNNTAPAYNSLTQMQRPGLLGGAGATGTNQQLPYSPNQKVKDLFTPWGQQLVGFPQTPAVSRKPAGYPQTQQTPAWKDPGLIAPPAGLNMNGVDPYVAPGGLPDNLSKFSTTPTRPAFDPVKSMAVPSLTNNDPNALRPNNIKVGAEAQAQEAQYKTPGTSMLPFALSAGLGAIGDIAGMINANKGPKSVNLGRMSAQNIDLEPQRQQMRRDYQSTQNVNLRNSRDMSSPANAYANMVAGNTDLMDSYGSAMGQSYMSEQNTNAQLRQQAAQQNASLQAQEAQMNLGLDVQRNQQRGQYIDRLASNIPNAMKDYRQQANQQNTINLMGQDMGMYQHVLGDDATWLQKLSQRMGVDPRVILARLDTRIQK